MTETAAKTIEEILSDAENPAYVRVATARVLLRQDLINRHTELDAALSAAVTGDALSNGEPTSPGIAAELQELEAEIEASKVEFKFKSIGNRAWADLLAGYPPTKDQLKRDPRIDHNPETFPTAALAASCVDPAMSLEQAARLDQLLDLTNWSVLWAACLSANIGSSDAPKSLAAGAILRANGRSANTPAPAASPAPSSSDE